MTMPDERTKSLRWGYEVLGELNADLEVPDDLRARAQAVCAGYPTPRTIQALIASNARRLPADMAEAIEAARTLFVDIQLSGMGSAATRKSLLYTLRHFPPVGSARHAAEVGFPGGIELWVSAMDDPR